jgi:hypothetical protein
MMVWISACVRDNGEQTRRRWSGTESTCNRRRETVGDDGKRRTKDILWVRRKACLALPSIVNKANEMQINCFSMRFVVCRK